MKSALLVTSLECGKHGFVIRLSSRDEVIEDPCKFVSGVLDGFECTMASALRPVIIAEVGLVVVKGLSRHAKCLGHAVFGFDLGASDSATGTGAIFRAYVQPR